MESKFAKSSFGPSGRRPRLLALSVHWDDCSVALGTGAGLATEFWSQQPERESPCEPSNAQAGPPASRDALLLVDRLLVRTDTPLSAIDCLCFAKGPGAFTSLRVAAGLIQGLSLATSKPVAGICSLAAMVAQEPGWQAASAGLWRAGEAQAESARTWLQLSAIDARMGECYFGLHQCRSGHHPAPLMPPAVGKPAEAIALFDEVLLAQRAARDSATRIVLAGNAFRLQRALADWAQGAGFDPGLAAGRSPTAAAVLAVAASVGAPEAGPPQNALPVYVRDKVALDVAEQRAHAAGRALAGARRAGTQ